MLVVCLLAKGSQVAESWIHWKFMLAPKARKVNERWQLPMSIELVAMDGRMMLKPPGTGIAFNIEVSEYVTSGSLVPKWVWRHLVETWESKSKYPPASLEDIESRLKEADLRQHVLFLLS